MMYVTWKFLLYWNLLKQIEIDSTETEKPLQQEVIPSHKGL